MASGDLTPVHYRSEAVCLVGESHLIQDRIRCLIELDVCIYWCGDQEVNFDNVEIGRIVENACELLAAYIKLLVGVIDASCKSVLALHPCEELVSEARRKERDSRARKTVYHVCKPLLSLVLYKGLAPLFCSTIAMLTCNLYASIEFLYAVAHI